MTASEAGARIGSMLAAADAMDAGQKNREALSEAKALLDADAAGFLIHLDQPIGSTVYELVKGDSIETRTIDGQDWHRTVSTWQVGHHAYGYSDALYDLEQKRKGRRPRRRKFTTLEAAEAECARRNADPEKFSKEEA